MEPEFTTAMLSSALPTPLENSLQAAKVDQQAIQGRMVTGRGAHPVLPESEELLKTAYPENNNNQQAESDSGADSDSDSGMIS